MTLSSFLYSNQTNRTSHIFDGQTLTKETAAFQLCDITDPMLKNMIENLDGLRDVCDVRFIIIIIVPLICI